MAGAHHRGAFPRRSEAVRLAAQTQDAHAAAGRGEPVRCWRCGRTLLEHPAHKNGRRPWWTAGHVRDGDRTSPLLPEASTCNFEEGARHGHDLRKARTFRTSRRW